MALRRLASWLRVNTSLTFVLHHDIAISARSICSEIARALAADIIVAELQSDHINPEDSAFLHTSLMQGKLLLVIAAQARELPAELLRAWEAFSEDPDHTFAGAGRFIHFIPLDVPISPRLGTLGIIVPEDYRGSSLSFSPYHFWVSSIDMASPASPYTEVRILGRRGVSVSMKTLCFLHHRDDNTARHHGSVNEIMSGDLPITWTDLQSLLQAQANNNMFDILEMFERKGRTSSEQLDFAAEAIAFLRQEREKFDERIGGRGLEPTIYHALWYWARFEQQGYVFRGQRDSRWRQDTTLLRPNKDGAALTLATILERLQRTQSFLDELAAHEQQLVGRSLDERERLAIAQHYGMPTPLLDYTRSLAIAAFFATGSGDSSLLRASDIGIIYFIAPLDKVAKMPAPPTASGFDFAAAAGLRTGHIAMIEPELPDRENRIARQKGLFVEGFNSRDLQRLASGALYFRQQAGEAFEDVIRGITRERLLSPDAGLQRLADSIKPSPTRLSSQLGSTTVLGDDLFGSLGLSLPANLHKAHAFLDKVAIRAEQVEPGLWPKLKAIMEAHFNEARIAAQTAEIAAPSRLEARHDSVNIRYMIDDVDLALRELAELAALQPDTLLRVLASHRPHRFEREHHIEPVSLPSATPKALVALAIGLFLVGVEYMRTVRGEIALQYVQNAESLLYYPRTNSTIDH